MTLELDLKEKWVAALRSGKYAQTQLKLRNTDGYCCMGVLFDITGAKWERSLIETETYQLMDEDHFSQEGWLPRAINTYGIDRSSINDLVGLNDYANRSFSEIADYIEENL